MAAKRRLFPAWCRVECRASSRLCGGLLCNTHGCAAGRPAEGEEASSSVPGAGAGTSVTTSACARRPADLACGRPDGASDGTPVKGGLAPTSLWATAGAVGMARESKPEALSRPCRSRRSQTTSSRWPCAGPQASAPGKQRAARSRCAATPRVHLRPSAACESKTERLARGWVGGGRQTERLD